MADTNLIEIEGEIKWFDPRKGYGFIVGPEGQDIFVHFTVIEQDEGFRTFRDGERVIYDANDGARDEARGGGDVYAERAVGGARGGERAGDGSDRRGRGGGGEKRRTRGRRELSSVEPVASVAEDERAEPRGAADRRVRVRV